MSYRTYGEFADNYKPNIPVLAGHYCTYFTIGFDPGGTNEYMLGDMYNFTHYNRVLSTSEIQQNFEALRSRYGI